MNIESASLVDDLIGSGAAGLIAQKDPASAQAHHLNDMRQRSIKRLTQIEGAIERLSQRIERAQLGDTLLGIGKCGHNEL